MEDEDGAANLTMFVYTLVVIWFNMEWALDVIMLRGVE